MNNLPLGKCKIYHILKDENVITNTKYNSLLLNEKNMGPIYDIIINVNNMSKHLINIGLRSRIAFQKSLSGSENKKNLVLKHFNKLLKREMTSILTNNKKDLKIAWKNKLRDNMIDRLILNKDRIENNHLV